MKPDWKDAPEWANWLAMDDDGEWYWYEIEPFLAKGYSGTWYAKSSHRQELAVSPRTLSWKFSKEPRP